jgi:hypothetical protein
MWFGAPLAAYLCQRNVLIGLSFWGLLFANGLVHTAGGVTQGGYNTGLWTAAFLFVPLSVWVIYACAIRGPFKAGMIGNVGLLVYAAVIGFASIILAALASRFFKPELLRPVSTLTVRGKKHAEQGRT